MVQPPTFTQTQISYTKNQKSLHCPVGDLTMRNLAYTARLLESPCPTVFSVRKFPFKYLFFVLGTRFACVTLLPFTLCYIMSGVRLKYDGTRAETRFRLSAKRSSPFKSAGASGQLTTGG